MKIILYIATILIVLLYLFWEQIENFLGFYIFEIGNSLFITLLCTYLFLTDKKSFIKFILFSLSLNNLIDELTLKTDKIYLSEILTGVAILLFAIYKYHNDRKRTRFI